MTAQLDALRELVPCRNRCTRKGTEDELLPRKAGFYCEREWAPIHYGLVKSQYVVEHLWALKDHASSDGDDERVQSSSDAPIPGNMAAFDAANEIYSTLVYWCAEIATRYGLTPPVPAADAWKKPNGVIVGLPVTIGHSTARYTVGVMANWLDRNIDLILSMDDEDVQEITAQLRFVFQVNARFPTAERPRFADVACPDADCGGRIAVYPPKKYEDDKLIICEQCGRIFLESDFEHLIHVFTQVRQEQQKAAKVAERLAKKYAG